MITELIEPTDNTTLMLASCVDDLLNTIKNDHPDQSKHIARYIYSYIRGCHYNREFALEDVDSLTYNTTSGVKHGEHWSVNQIIEAYNGLTFPDGTTDSDKYVAANIMYARLNLDFDDVSILKTAYRFFFAEHTMSVWEYANNLL